MSELKDSNKYKKVFTLELELTVKSREIFKTINKPVSFKVKEIFPGLIHLEFKTQEDLTSSLLRFQEHYESPKFRKKIFSFSEFIQWYKTTRKGKFTYFSDWAGFNFPSYVIEPFADGRFKRITERERKILKKINKEGKFYVIGTFSSESESFNWEVKKHEIAHALFYLDDEYRRKVTEILAPYNCKKIHSYIKKLGYHKDVLLDETHAYILTDSEILSQEAGIVMSDFKEAKTQLEKLFKKHFEKKKRLS